MGVQMTCSSHLCSFICTDLFHLQGKKSFTKASVSPGNIGNTFNPVITASCKTVCVCFLLKLMLDRPHVWKGKRTMQP